MHCPIDVIGAPMDLGANRRGVDMGPSAIRYAGLRRRLQDLGLEVTDAGNVQVPFPDECETGQEGLRYADEIRSVCHRLTEKVRESLRQGRFPLVLGGDHSLAIGTVRGSARGARLGLLWFDAHGDINTPSSSPSGNLHGMPIAALLGHGTFSDEAWACATNLREQDVVYIGLRRLDPEEQTVIRESNMTAFTMRNIDREGIGTVVEQALETATETTEALHVSLDMDWVNPTEAPGVGTPVPGGVTYREAHLAMETIAERHRRDDLLRSMDIVEVNPILDEQNRTAELASELAASALGKTVL